MHFPQSNHGPGFQLSTHQLTPHFTCFQWFLEWRQQWKRQDQDGTDSFLWRTSSFLLSSYALSDIRKGKENRGLEWMFGFLSFEVVLS
jgi:hypothetical protein